jgi:hypothetical protein
MPFVKVEKILPKSVKKAGIFSQLVSVKILDEFPLVIEKMFGPAVMKKIKPLYLKNGTLSIGCLYTVLAQQLKADEQKILAELNRPYRKKIVERLRFLV